MSSSSTRSFPKISASDMITALPQHSSGGSSELARTIHQEITRSAPAKYAQQLGDGQASADRTRKSIAQTRYFAHKAVKHGFGNVV